MTTLAQSSTKLTSVAFALGLALSLPVAAQAQPNNITFNIPQQPLSHALNQLAEQANMTLIADANVLKNHHASALYGQRSVSDALTTILQGTGIIAQVVGNNIIIKTTDSATPNAHNSHNSNGTNSLVTEEQQSDIEVIVVKGNQLHLKHDEIDRTRGNSNSDIFSTFTGIEANNLRNEAGALDIGIRGVQGEGRVPVFIDGSLQSTHTNRGYMGTSDRTYIDSDLISTVNVEKGASTKASPFGSGAIGGTVTISTLTPFDILKEGEQSGVLIKAKTYNNNQMPSVSDNPWEQEYYQLDSTDNRSDFENGGLVVAGAYKGNDFDVVIAASKKKTGNYFAGNHGYEEFVEVSPFGTEFLPPVNRKGEVVNTSFDSESYLAKFNYAFTDEHSIEVNTRHHQQEAGEMLASYWLKQSEGDFWVLPDGSYDIIPEGVETMPQWEPGTAYVNSASAIYHYLPTNNDLVDLKVNIWSTNAKLKQYNALGANLGPNAYQYLHQYSNQRHGLGLYNTSSFKLADSINTVVTAGASWQSERLQPQEGSEENFYGNLPTSRNGKQVSRSLFANAQFDLNPVELVLNVNMHDAKSDDNQTGLSEDFSPKTDFTAQVYYPIFSHTTLKAKYSSAYRMPNVYETTISNEVFTYSPYYPISPEKTNSYELGFESQFNDTFINGDNLSISASYFDTKIEDMIATAELPNLDPNAEEWQRTTYTFTNYDSFSLPGIEVLLNYQSDYFYASASMTKYQDVEMCSSDFAEIEGVERCNNQGFSGSLTPLRIPPEKSYVATIGSTFLDDQLDLGFIYKKHSEKQHPGGFLSGTGVDAIEHIPEGYQLDMYIDYRFNNSVSAYTTITNLTDRYNVSSGSIVAVPEPGRTVTIGLELKL